MAKPRQEPKSSTKEPIVGDSQSTAESKRIGVSIHPDSSYDETTPLNADASGQEQSTSDGFGEDLQNQDKNSADSSDDQDSDSDE